MKRIVMGAALLLLANLWAGAATADIYCGMRCVSSPYYGGICLGPEPPTLACSTLSGGCMSVPASNCGGNPGCGFDGELCGPENQFP